MSNEIKKYTLRDKSSKASLTFTNHGATPLELTLIKDGKSFQIFDGFKTDEQLIANEKSRNIFLIPFPNRIRDGAYEFEGMRYRLPINKKNENNAIHGFIWNRIFEVQESGDTATLSYQYEGDFQGFPFPFLVTVKYTLSANSLHVTLDVINNGSSAMPLGIGWHPYFTFHKPIEQIQLQLPESDILELDNRLLPTGKREAYQQFKTLQKIGSTNFDTAFETKGNPIETRLYATETNTTILVQQDNGFKYLQVYIPTERNSIAIEPMTCPANAFNSGEGLIKLKNRQSFSGTIRITVV